MHALPEPDPTSHAPAGARSPARLAALGVALIVSALALAYVVEAVALARRRANLRDRVAAERAVLPERSRALVAAMDDVMLEAARSPWPGDLVPPELATPEARRALLATELLYVRAAVPEIARVDAIGAAVRRSAKDAFVLCLRHPPASTEPAEMRRAATRQWLGGALFDDATHDVVPLHAVHAGLRPLSAAFAAEMEEADQLPFVRRLETEHEQRTPIALALARTAASLPRLVVVADELPEGFREPDVGKGLMAADRPAVLPRIEDAPHRVRIVVWSTDVRRVVLRMRTSVDPRAPGEGAAAEVNGCQAATALVGTRPTNGPAAPPPCATE